ncbi:MAG: hypothetical protein PSV35_10575, partial [bacterium]|nr:hypothetical protein [bacterium]
GINTLHPVVGNLPVPSAYSGQASPRSINVLHLKGISVGNHFHTPHRFTPITASSLETFYNTTFGSWLQLLNVSGTLKSNYNYLNDVSCSSISKTCVSVGNYQDRSKGKYYVPVVYYSQDAGVTWFPSLTLFPSQFLYTVSCSSVGDYCIAGGNTATRSGPLVYISLDYGRTWRPSTNFVTQAGDSYYNVQKISCDTTGQTCTLVGFYKRKSTLNTLEKNSLTSVINYLSPRPTGTIYPFSYSTINGGKQWTRTTAFPATGSTQNYLNSVSCSASGKMCTTVGVYRTYENNIPRWWPLVYYTNNGGISWSKSALTNTTTNDGSVSSIKLNSVGCNATGLNCVAFGLSYQINDNFRDSDHLIAYYSLNGGKNWNTSATLPNPPESYCQSVSKRISNISCEPSGRVCSAVGSCAEKRKTTAAPINYITFDSGKSWQYNPSIVIPHSADYVMGIALIQE